MAETNPAELLRLQIELAQLRQDVGKAFSAIYDLQKITARMVEVSRCGIAIVPFSRDFPYLLQFAGNTGMIQELCLSRSLHS